MTIPKKSGKRTSPRARRLAASRTIGRDTEPRITVTPPTVEAGDVYNPPTNRAGGTGGRDAIVQSGDLTEEEREKIRRMRQKKNIQREKKAAWGRDNNEIRGNYYFNADLLQKNEQLSQDLKTSQSSLMTFYFYFFMREMAERNINPKDYLIDFAVSENHPRFQCRLVHPDDPTQKGRSGK